MSADIDQLDSLIDAALESLTSRQRKFAEIYAAGDNGSSADIKAGYSVNRAKHTAYRLATNGHPKVHKAIALLRKRHALEHGIPAAWKRKKLQEIADAASDPTQDGYQPGSAVRAVNELNLMDGHHAPKQHQLTSMNISVEYKLDMPSRVINDESDDDN